MVYSTINKQKFKSPFFFSTRAAEAEPERIEFEIDFANDLKEGEMRPLKVGPKDEDKVLVVRY